MVPHVLWQRLVCSKFYAASSGHSVGIHTEYREKLERLDLGDDTGREAPEELVAEEPPEGERAGSPLSEQVQSAGCAVLAMQQAAHISTLTHEFPPQYLRDTERC